MEADEYARLAQQESWLWWFELLHRNLFASLDALGLHKPSLKCADFGCGTGGFAAKLQKHFPSWSVVGLDRSITAVAFARQKYGTGFVVGDAQRPPFKSNLFDIVFAIDVMYSRHVEPGRMLQAIFAVLKPGGIVILNNPAYEWLRSYHDTFVHTGRRYTTTRVATELNQAGFAIVRCTYWNTVLFPIMVLKRKLLTGPASHSDVAAIPSWLNQLFFRASLPETAAMRYGVNLPFGGSVLAIGRKGL